MTRYRTSGVGVLIAAVMLSGCAEKSRGSAVTVTDSAGVEVVTNLSGSVESAEPWSLSESPVFEIGAGADPEVALYRITAVVPLLGGGVAIGTNTPPRVLIFDADGTLTATLGREGRGPGEFSSIGSVVPIATDSVAVWDPNRRRISLFTAAGEYVREVDLSAIAPVTAAATPDARTSAGFTYLLPSTPGSLFLFGEGVFSSEGGSGVGRPELPAFRMTTEGEQLANLGTFPGMEVFFGSPAGTLPLPFGARTYVAASEGALVVGTADATEFRVVEPTGALARIVRWPDRQRTVGGTFLATWSEIAAAQPAVRGLVESVPRSEHYPAYEGLISTDAGEILVGEYAGPVGVWPVRRADDAPDALKPVRIVPERRWLVFNPDGALTASVPIPEGFEPYAVRDDLVWGVFTDELDVESVRAYRLSRTPWDARPPA